MSTILVRKRERQERILLSLDRLGFATREQLQQVHALGQKRNALKILQGMSEWLNVRRHPERDCANVYYLNKEGCRMIGSETERKYTSEVEHYLMRNDVYIHFNCPDDFVVEREVAFRVGHAEKIIKPDARFSYDDKICFLEVDRTQSMAANKKKIERYAELSPLFQEQFAYPPVIIFYTLTESRRERLYSLAEEHGVKVMVLSRYDLKTV
ncbi:replication-relaxation family protein [Bacillus badius]|uniref:replication-relaxation family protein n=1 Tax=Bacillus badius TaxID=1455 RepID=UPI0005977578|nr:replication-relaxation family protein [Bacillus badius]MED4716310.1 replication-relaxation family protein [Bacillus badius]